MAMAEYDFTLKFMLDQPHADPESFVDRLFEAGCEDAIVGIGEPGRIALNFVREADSASEAVVTAIQDVKQAIPEVRFTEASPDFVGLSDLAELLGVSRQYVRKIVEANVYSFPAPVHDGKRPIWHLEPVLVWLDTNRVRPIDEVLIELSRANMSVNDARNHASTNLVISGSLIRAVG